MVFPSSISLPYSTFVAVCDRPGCSEPVFLQYGFDSVAAVVWLELPQDADASGLCELHAERLIAPKGWTIDDRRDPALRLFRPGPSNRQTTPTPKRRAVRSSTMAQAELFEPISGSAPSSENSHWSSRGSVDESALAEGEEENTSPLTPLLSRAFRGTRLESD